ncbi:Lem3/Cdc50 [Xylona heveae TC161]|uniref:Lem3/Cdc50 n=1 Tax=Xylona heveae (strain CBS 132557 / TC161) TaxID=1328760 RepID=A0A165F8X3_XYLHT|nr:Lem3/Cdc50 [Xylona heveae TC161]KZF20716.1 Lem3/Cdc50 [Xylona heveae TC161]
MSTTEPVRTDSIHEQDPHFVDEKKQKSRRPGNTAFRQQRLKAWQPILTPKTVLPLFFAVGIIFAPIGGLLIWASSQVQEVVLDYSDCWPKAPMGNFSTMEPDLYSYSFKSSPNSTSISKPQWKRDQTLVHYGPGAEVDTTVCSVRFDLPDPIGPPVFLYYRLTNFYQNHRRYVASLDDNQLKGDAVSNSTIKGGSCNPLRLADNGKAYYPCGLIANSLFNDTFASPVLLNTRKSSADNETYPMTNKNIAWASDKDLYGKTKYTPDQVMPPRNWALRYPNGYTEEQPPPDLSEDEGFQVWMRTAGLPTFSKLALRNDNLTMAAGTYQIDIQLNFPVSVYGGKKMIVISTRTIMGGKNPFLGIAYVVVGGICIVLGTLFTITHLIKPRKLGDHTYLSWNNDQPTTATVASGRDVRPGMNAA